jgi:hypothetical protein
VTHVSPRDMGERIVPDGAEFSINVLEKSPLTNDGITAAEIYTFKVDPIVANHITVIRFRKQKFFSKDANFVCSHIRPQTKSCKLSVCKL